MPRLWLPLSLAAILMGCAGSTYSIEAENLAQANERAARYCGEQQAIARLEEVRRQGDRNIQVYRCVALERPADVSARP